MRCGRDDERKYSAANIVISVNPKIQEVMLIYRTSLLHTGALNPDCRSRIVAVQFLDSVQALLEAIAPKDQTLNQFITAIETGKVEISGYEACRNSASG